MHQGKLKKGDSEIVISFVQYQVQRLLIMDITMCFIFHMNLHLRVSPATIFASLQTFLATVFTDFHSVSLTHDPHSSIFCDLRSMF